MSVSYNVRVVVFVVLGLFFQYRQNAFASDGSSGPGTSIVRHGCSAALLPEHDYREIGNISNLRHNTESIAAVISALANDVSQLDYDSAVAVHLLRTMIATAQSESIRVLQQIKNAVEAQNIEFRENRDGSRDLLVVLNTIEGDRSFRFRLHPDEVVGTQVQQEEIIKSRMLKLCMQAEALHETIAAADRFFESLVARKYKTEEGLSRGAQLFVDASQNHMKDFYSITEREEIEGTTSAARILKNIESLVLTLESELRKFTTDSEQNLEKFQVLYSEFKTLAREFHEIFKEARYLQWSAEDYSDTRSASIFFTLKSQAEHFERLAEFLSQNAMYFFMETPLVSHRAYLRVDPGQDRLTIENALNEHGVTMDYLPYFSGALLDLFNIVKGLAPLHSEGDYQPPSRIALSQVFHTNFIHRLAKARVIPADDQSPARKRSMIVAAVFSPANYFHRGLLRAGALFVSGVAEIPATVSMEVSYLPHATATAGRKEVMVLRPGDTVLVGNENRTLGRIVRVELGGGQVPTVSINYYDGRRDFFTRTLNIKEMQQLSWYDGINADFNSMEWNVKKKLREKTSRPRVLN